MTYLIAFRKITDSMLFIMSFLSLPPLGRLFCLPEAGIGVDHVPVSSALGAV